MEDKDLLADEDLLATETPRKPSIRPLREIMGEIPEQTEFGRGVVLSGKRMGAAVGQFLPPTRERATKMSQDIEQELSESTQKRVGATVADIFGLGKLAQVLKVPQYIQAGKTGLSRIGRAGTTGGAATALTMPIGEDEESFAGAKATQFGVGFAGSAALQKSLEAAKKYFFPGTRAEMTPDKQQAIDFARQRGYTVPISELTENAAINTLDRVFDNPLVQRNAPVFARQINSLMGFSGDTLGPDAMRKASQSLSQTASRLMSGKQIDLGQKFSAQSQNLLDQTLKGVPAVEPRQVQAILESAQKAGGTTIDGTTWHKTRQLLNDQYVSLLGRNSPDAPLMRQLINEWDEAAFASIKDQGWRSAFELWKTRWTVFADVSEAVNLNQAARQNFVKGVLDPVDLMNVTAAKRPGEFVRRFYEPPGTAGVAGGRPQTTEAGVAGALNIYGREGGPQAIAPYYRAATAPKFLGTLVGAKKLQEQLYTPGGQRLIYEGLQPSQAAGITAMTQPFITDLSRYLTRPQE